MESVINVSFHFQKYLVLKIKSRIMMESHFSRIHAYLKVCNQPFTVGHFENLNLDITKICYVGQFNKGSYKDNFKSLNQLWKDQKDYSIVIQNLMSNLQMQHQSLMIKNCQSHCLSNPLSYLPWIHFSINKSWTIFLFYHDGVKRLKRVSKIFETNQIMIQNIHEINVIIKLFDLHIFIYT